MSEPDRAYWRRRYWEECRNAAQAHTPEVRVFHRRLAQAYGDRLLKPRGEARDARRRKPPIQPAAGD